MCGDAENGTVTFASLSVAAFVLGTTCVLLMDVPCQRRGFFVFSVNQKVRMQKGRNTNTKKSSTES